MRYCHSQPMKSHWTSNSQFTPTDFLFVTAIGLPTPLPAPIKEHSSPLFSGSLYVLNWNSLQFPNQPIFASEITDSLVFKVNITWWGDMGSREDSSPPTTPRLVSKQVPDPKEPIELTAFLQTLEFDHCSLCVCVHLYRLYLRSIVRPRPF